MGGCVHLPQKKPHMEYGHIENIDKPVSRMIFGTAHALIQDKSTCNELLDAVHGLGFTAFDTAVLYGDMESNFGDWLHSRGLRDQVVIITKGAHPNQWRKRVTPYDILSDIHDSLAKLKTDYIDVYLLHRDDPDVPVGPIVELLNQLRDEGKIGVFGGSNWSRERIEEANAYAQAHHLFPFTVSSPFYSLGEQTGDPWGNGCLSISGPDYREDRVWYKKNNIAVLAYLSLARGLFAGKIKSTEWDRAAELFEQPIVDSYGSERNFQKLERVELLAEQKGCSVAQVSLAWLLQQDLEPFVLLSGNERHMRENIKAFDIRLTRNEMEWLDLATDTLA